MTTVQKIADRGLRIADGKPTLIRNPKSEIRNSARQAAPSAFEEAARYLVGGVNSPVRAFRDVGREPLMLARGRGATVVETDGRPFIDFIGGWGALILGHHHPRVVAVLRRALSQGVLTGLTHPAEVALARLITEAVPSVEQVRFTVSGTEACMTAVRLARAATSRTKILAFDGCYHGHGDSVMARKTAGIPATWVHDTLTIPFNDLPAFEEAIEHFASSLACVILEPVAANMGVVAPEPRFLECVRTLTRRHGIMLIFDEVVTGFRLGYSGAQGRFRISPDLTTFGKIIGGGLPIGALGGPARLMQRLAPEGDVYHGGTFAGHPLSMAAGIATLHELKAHPPYDRIAQLTRQLIDGLRREAQRAGVPVQVNVTGSMFTVFFSDSPVKNVAQAKASRRDEFARWAVSLRRKGILVAPSPFEAVFVSSAHTERHVDRFIGAANAAFRNCGAH